MWHRNPLTYIVALIVFVVYDYVANLPKAQSVANDLKQELAAIMPLPKAVPLDHHEVIKPREVLVGSEYATSQSYSEIRRYYDQELAQHGWAFYREEEVRDWGRNLGGRIAHYRKRGYTASLQYAGERANDSWNFALDLSWGP